jgi:Leucine-rich repeat (LRR) protein
MIWLRHEKSMRWEIEYHGPGGAFLRPLLGVTGIKSLALTRNVFSGCSVDFFNCLTRLEGLTIVDWKLKNALPIEHLTNLRKLRLQTPALDGPVDLRRFPELQELSAEAAGIVTALESCANLEQLFIVRFKSRTLSSLNTLRKLKVAEFSEPAFNQIGPVDLPKLESLIFKAARDLEDWSGLEGLPALKKLWLFKAPNLKSLDVFKQMRELDWLLLEDCGRLESLQPIAHLPTLRQVNIIGNTHITDGQMSALLSAPNLQEVSFPSRPGYDMTEKQLADAIAKRKPGRTTRF